MSAHGTVHWSELMTRDVEAAKQYYATVCGWSFNEMPMPDGVYHVAMNGDQPTAGIMAMDSPQFADVDPQWVTYLAVDDVGQAVEQTRAAGGTIVQDVFEVPGVGRIAMIEDPGGASIGIMTPAESS